MAKGITQAQVDTAADALVIAGERPTVDRIRAFLGTGSPNTVTRMLETWWQSLGARLTAQQARAELPGVPESVAVLATQLWDAALQAAQAEASQSCSAQMDAIAARATQLEVDRQAWMTAPRHCRSPPSSRIRPGYWRRPVRPRRSNLSSIRLPKSKI
jgi:hypothetical protein